MNAPTHHETVRVDRQRLGRMLGRGLHDRELAEVREKAISPQERAPLPSPADRERPNRLHPTDDRPSVVDVRRGARYVRETGERIDPGFFVPHGPELDDLAVAPDDLVPPWTAPAGMTRARRMKA